MDVDAAALFERHAANPIITAGQLPYHANSVFNPGAARVGDDTVLLARVEDLRGISHLVGRAECGRRLGLAVRRRRRCSPRDPRITRRRSGAARTPA